MTPSVGAVDDAAPGVAEALLLFALAFAAAGCAEGSRLAALGFAAAGTDGARGGARGTDVGVGASFVAGAGAVVGVFIDATTLLSRSFFALAFFTSSFRKGFLTLRGGSGPPPGGGAMPLADSPGPLTSISAKSLGLVFLASRNRRCFAAIPWWWASRDIFPTAIDAP